MTRYALSIMAAMLALLAWPAAATEYSFSGPNQTSPDQTWSGMVDITPDIADGLGYFDLSLSFVEAPGASDPGVSGSYSTVIWCGYCSIATRFDHDGSGNLLPFFVDGALISLDQPAPEVFNLWGAPPASFYDINFFIDRNAPGCDGCGTSNEMFSGPLTLVPAPGPVLGSALPGVALMMLMGSLIWRRT